MALSSGGAMTRFVKTGPVVVMAVVSKLPILAVSCACPGGCEPATTMAPE